MKGRIRSMTSSPIPLPLHPLPPPAHPAGILGSRVLRWPDEAACAATARALAARPALREALVELHGTLGAGKTTFVRHLLRALGETGRVRSPTYALLETYRLGTLEVAHHDFDRFGDPHEWEDAGLRDVFARPGLKLVEWPAQAGTLLPAPDLRLWLEADDDGTRHVTFEACSARGLALLPEPQT